MPLIESSYPHVLGALNGPTAPKRSFLIFYSNVVDGRMWCPDCRVVEDAVKKAFQGEDKPQGIIYWVGSLAQWRDKNNHARTSWNVNSVPTILRIEDGKETGRIVENEILDSAKLKALLSGE
ncbi:uncharacterized protein EHS24_009695 [Apiotrichum porosum]|uniref:Thioredoxin domain-containing protein n=1 Tax=Apiotrichum porosum TaxID=105984 RepID=A0A427XMP4_9TREE|nr:uncharacterized protein EHS24_009695 [Apiotrichum porosum]RSH80024.1 hypothetical protein EHS24_009695 [Apiotrichum porosum]